MPVADPELEKLLAKVRELEIMAESGSAGETLIRSLARNISRNLKRYGYIVVVRRAPPWTGRKGLQVFLSKLGRRGRGGSREDSDDYFPDFEGLREKLSGNQR